MTDTVRDDQLDDKYIYNIETRYAGRITITVKEMLKGLPEYQKLLGFVRKCAFDYYDWENTNHTSFDATELLEEIGGLDD